MKGASALRDWPDSLISLLVPFIDLAQFSYVFALNCASSNWGMKSELHPACATAASLFHHFPMKIFFRCFILLSWIAVDLISFSTVFAQNLPNTTRLLRFPTTNDRE